MPTVPVLDGKGKKQESLDLRADVFPETVRVPLVHQAVVKELAARRAGTHDTKGRSEVSGDRKSTRLNSSHIEPSRMPSSA